MKLARHNSASSLGHPGGDVWYDAPQGPRNPQKLLASHPLRDARNKTGRYHDAREPRTAKRPKTDWGAVNWQKELGAYSPNRDYRWYAQSYQAKLRAAKSDAERARLQRAWRAMRKTGITQNKRGLNRRLLAENSASEQGRKRLAERAAQKAAFRAKASTLVNVANRRAAAEEHRVAMRAIDARYIGATDARRRLKRHFRRGELNTGRVALPPVPSRQRVKAMVKIAYDKANLMAVKGVARVSLTKLIQAQFLKRFKQLVELAMVAVPKKVQTAAAGLAGAIAGGVTGAAVAAAMPGFVPVVLAKILASTFTSLGAFWAGAKATRAVVADPTLGSGVVAAGLKGAIRLGGAAVGATWKLTVTVGRTVAKVVEIPGVIVSSQAAMLADKFTWLVERVLAAVGTDLSAAQRVVGEVLQWVLVKFGDDVFHSYMPAGVRADVRAFPGILRRNAGTVGRALAGEDVSLRGLAVDVVDAVRAEDLEAMGKALDRHL